MILAVATFTAAIVSASVQPPAPKVGDLITVTFEAPATLDPSGDYEVVSRDRNRVVVRTFKPEPFALSGTIGNVRFRDLKVPVGSVLKRADDLAPAPLAPPRPVDYPRLPWIAIGIAALLALLAWIAVWLRAKKPAAAPVPQLTAEERFRRAVATLRQNPSRPLRWAALADATRAYLAATRPQLGSDLTTTELVPRLAEQERIVAEILRQGDLEKFSRRGPAPREFDELADRVMELAS
jgi:hypothetical protein